MSEQVRERGWMLQPAIAGRMGPCLCCGVASDFFPAEAYIAVGFGMAALTCDGSLVYAEDTALDDDDGQLMTGKQAEDIAAKDPNHDWRITLHGPMRSREYQRHAPGQWALIEQGEGFA